MGEKSDPDSQFYYNEDKEEEEEEDDERVHLRTPSLSDGNGVWNQGTYRTLISHYHPFDKSFFAKIFVCPLHIMLLTCSYYY